MKRLLAIYLSILAFMMVGAHAAVSASSADGISISGKIKDTKSKKPLSYSTIAVEGSNIATVSNADGAFTLNIPDSLRQHSVVISHLGYANVDFPIAGWFNGCTVLLGKSAKELDEIVVVSGNPRDIVEIALRKISDNYPLTTDMLSVFYRETIQKGKRYTEVSEGVMDVLKTTYKHRNVIGDKVQVLKGRKLMSQKSSDTLAIKMIGGPNMAVALDFVKNPDFFLAPDELDAYEFKMERSVVFDDRRQYAISFRPIVKLDYPLMKGTLFIDAQLLAFTRAELELDMSDKQMVINSLLRKKPAGLKFNPLSVKFTVTYRQGEDGRTCLNYVFNEMKFKCDWKRRLFSSAYTAVAELVVVDREAGTESSISRQQTFKSKDSFSDLAIQYWDEDFWQGYNIIEPSESLESAVLRLLKNQSKKR